MRRRLSGLHAARLTARPDGSVRKEGNHNGSHDRGQDYFLWRVLRYLFGHQDGEHLASVEVGLSSAVFAR